MNKVLVTGAAGFIGSHTVEYLESKKFKVLGLDNFSSGKIENTKEFRGTVELCDVMDIDLLERVFDKFRPDSVIHLAAQSAITTAWDDPQKDMEVNILGSLNIATLSKRYEVKKVVFSSTAAVYGKGNRFSSSFENDKCEPDTPYGVSKLASEHYFNILFPNCLALRYANVYGPRQVPIGENQLVARALSHFIKGDDFHVVGDGNQKRDFVFVGDIVHANYLALLYDNQPHEKIFNVASGHSISVNRVLQEIEMWFDVKGYKWVHTKEQDLRGNVYMNGSKFRRATGWSPVINIASGIDLTANWWHGK